MFKVQEEREVIKLFSLIAFTMIVGMFIETIYLHMNIHCWFLVFKFSHLVYFGIRFERYWVICES